MINAVGPKCVACTIQPGCDLPNADSILFSLDISVQGTFLSQDTCSRHHGVRTCKVRTVHTDMAVPSNWTSNYENSRLSVSEPSTYSLM